MICNRSLSACAKRKVYKTVVRPAMLYGLETVPLTKKQEAELAVAQLKMLTFSLGVTRMDKIKNEFIRVTAHKRQIGDKVREARLSGMDTCRDGMQSILVKGCCAWSCQVKGEEEDQRRGS